MWESAVFHSSLSLSLLCFPQLWARAQFVVLCCRALSVRISGICSWGLRSWYGFRLPPSWAGYKYGARSLLYMRAFSCCSLGTSSRGVDPENYDEYSFVSAAVKEDGSIFACLSLCLCLFIFSRSAVSQLVWPNFQRSVVVFWSRAGRFVLNLLDDGCRTNPGTSASSSLSVRLRTC